MQTSENDCFSQCSLKPGLAPYPPQHELWFGAACSEHCVLILGPAGLKDLSTAFLYAAVPPSPPLSPHFWAQNQAGCRVRSQTANFCSLLLLKIN